MGTLHWESSVVFETEIVDCILSCTLLGVLPLRFCSDISGSVGFVDMSAGCSICVLFVVECDWVSFGDMRGRSSGFCRIEWMVCCVGKVKDSMLSVRLSCTE